MERRAALEVMIAYDQSLTFKAEHRMARNIAPNYLRGRGGDHINAVLAAAGHNYDLSCADWPGFCPY
jgi:transposase, IS5 family